MQTNLKRYGFYSLMDKSPGCFRCDANARIEFLNLVLVVPVTISSKWAFSLLLCQLQFVCFPLLRSETRKFWWTLYFTFFVLLRTSGYMLKGLPAGVNLARSKSNLSVILRLACASCIEHDTHTHWSVQLRPLKSLSQSKTHHSLSSSVMCLSWERMPTAGWWLHVMLCDWRVCPWCAVVPSIHEHELLSVSLPLGLHFPSSHPSSQASSDASYTFSYTA